MKNMRMIMKGKYTYSYKTKAMFDAKASMYVVLQALLFTCNRNELCVNGTSSRTTPNRANNLRIVPECVKYIDANLSLSFL